MHSSLNRVQAVFGFFTTVAMFVAGFAALSVLLHPATDARSEVQLNNVQVIKGRPHYYSTKREEYAQIRFDLDADLSPLFNWNTKQLFIYVLASYPSDEKNLISHSQSIIWDLIIPAPESPYSFNSLRERFVPASKSSSRNGYLSSSSSGTGRKRSTTKQQQQKNKKKPSQPGILHLRNQRPKYQISDITGRTAEKKNVTLTVGWNVQPWIGALWWGPGDGVGTGTVPRTEGLVMRSEMFDFPALKGSNNNNKKTGGAGSSNRDGGSSAAI